MFDAIEPKDILVPEVAFVHGLITHDEYRMYKEMESWKLKDGRVQ